MFTGTTHHFELGVYVRTDRPVDPGGDWSEDFLKIDTALHDNVTVLETVDAFVVSANAANNTMTDTLSTAEQTIADAKQNAEGLNTQALDALTKAKQAGTLADAAASNVTEANKAVSDAQSDTQTAAAKNSDNTDKLSELTGRVAKLESRAVTAEEFDGWFDSEGRNADGFKELGMDVEEYDTHASWWMYPDGFLTE